MNVGWGVILQHNFFHKSIVTISIFGLAFFAISTLFVSCKKVPEMTLEEIEQLVSSQSNCIESNTITKPWKGESFVDGKVGGTWHTSITSDPKSFNLLVAERDGATNGVLSYLVDSLLDYNYATKEWKGRLAEPRIVIDEKNDKMDVFFTLRDDLYWTYYDSDERVKVTSDDVLFWYNEIVGDPDFQSSGYNGQFIDLADGTEAHVDMEKVDERTFVFHYPRIIADPLLHCNMNFGPKFLYGAAKEKGGVQAVKSLFSIDVDPKTIPSIGRNYLVEYSPSQRLVYKRNPNFWEKDLNGNAICYPEQMIVDIVSDRNTEYLLFREGKLEDYSPRPEELVEVIEKAGDDYSVFNGGGSLGASLWSFNQNPKNSSKPYYSWFCKKEFRQAMSCILNRERIIEQTYRGMGEPKYDFFPEPNPFYNPDIQLQYRFDLEKAGKLLDACGCFLASDGNRYDDKKNKIEFDLTIVGNDGMTQDIATIISDEASKVGVTVKIRTLDFQKIVEQLTSTYDWQSIIIGLGTTIFPTQGSNVWPSNGNLHLWYPLQSEPATEWEARIDELYNEGSCTIDKKKAAKIWDEYQSIILEQCPVVYLIRGRSFYAIRNRWDLTNLYYDNMGGAQTEHLYLKE